MQQRFTLLALTLLTLLATNLRAASPAELPVADTLVTILNPDTVSLCRGDTLQLRQINNVGDSIVWILRPAGRLSSPTDTSPTVVVQTAGYLVLGAGPGLDDCDLQDSIYLDVNNFVLPELVADTTICEGDDLLLVQDFVDDTGETLYDWGPGTFLDDSTDVNAVFIPSFGVDTVFTLVAESENGVCIDSNSVRVMVTPSRLEISGPDTVEFCMSDDTASLNVFASPGNAQNLRWFPTDGIIGSNTGSGIRVDMISDRTYYVEATVNGCFQLDSVSVRVDSLPEDMTITLNPEEDPYCPGDTISLVSPIYDPQDYPLITHEWRNLPGLASPTELYNAVVFASDTTLALRINENGACLDTSSVQINVLKPPIPIFDPPNPVVCPGEPIQVTVSFDPSAPMGTVEWMDPGNNLSCTECLDPTIRVDESTTFELVVSSIEADCSSETLTYTVRIGTDLVPELNEQTTVCVGDNRRIIVGGVQPDYNYRITGPGVDSNDPELVVTLTEDATFRVESMGPCGTTTDEVSFDVVGNYTVSISGETAVCGGEALDLTATVNTERQGQFIWTGPGLDQPFVGQQLELAIPQSGTYEVTFVDNLCGNSASEQVEVTVVDQMLVLDLIGVFNGMNLMNGDDIFRGAVGEFRLLGAESIDNFTVDYVANIPGDGDGERFTLSVPTGDDTPGTFNLNATLTTAEGCTFSAAISVNVLEPQNEIPEIISPNGDGTNDVFRVFFGGQLDNFTLSVFNRWGQEVFSSSDPTQGWNGEKDGEPQNPDTYIYYARFTQNGVEITKEGQFVLVR